MVAYTSAGTDDEEENDEEESEAFLGPRPQCTGAASHMLPTFQSCMLAGMGALQGKSGVPVQAVPHARAGYTAKQAGEVAAVTG